MFFDHLVDQTPIGDPEDPEWEDDDVDEDDNDDDDDDEEEPLRIGRGGLRDLLRCIIDVTQMS